MSDSFGTCNTCGIPDGGNYFKYQLKGLSENELEMIDSYTDNENNIAEDDYDEVSNIIGREPDYEELEFCKECGNQTTFSWIHVDYYKGRIIQ